MPRAIQGLISSTLRGLNNVFGVKAKGSHLRASREPTADDMRRGPFGVQGVCVHVSDGLYAR